jgi:hypothetical protein
MAISDRNYKLKTIQLFTESSFIFIVVWCTLLGFFIQLSRLKPQIKFDTADKT